MIIFLYGEDDFRSLEKLNEIKEKFLQTNASGSNLSVIDFDEKQPQLNLGEIAGTGGLFFAKRLIIIKNAATGSGTEKSSEILELLKNKKRIVQSKDVILVFWEKGIPAKNNALFRFLEKMSDKKQLFEKLQGAKLVRWTISQIKKNGGQEELSLPNLNKLIAYAGDDLFQLDNEIKKLVNFKGGEKIGAEDIDLLVKAKISANIFAAIEALSENDKKKALSLLHLQLEKGEDPFYIFSMYVYQFRTLLRIGDLFWQKKFNQYQIAKETGIHPYVAQKGLAQLKNFNLKKLKDIYQKLQDIDLEIKTGKIDIKLALDKFILEI